VQGRCQVGRGAERGGQLQPGQVVGVRARRLDGVRLRPAVRPEPHVVAVARQQPRDDRAPRARSEHGDGGWRCSLRHGRSVPRVLCSWPAPSPRVGAAPLATTPGGTGKMPVYVYRNLVTGETFEIEQRMTEAALTEHPETGEPVKRLIQPIGIAFKGSGFYVNDSRSKPASADSSASSSSSAD